MAKRAEIVVVGRGQVDDAEGKYALTMYRADNASIPAYNEEGTFVPQDVRLVNVLITHACDVINSYVNDAKFVGNINVHTVRQGFVLKYREIAKMMRTEREDGVPFSKEKLFKDFHTEADRRAIGYLADTVKNALDHKCTIRFLDVSMASYIDLLVPQGVEIADGTIADFENGKALVNDVNGMKREILVRNWDDFARKDAKIIKMRNADAKYPVYALERTLSDKKTKLESVVSDLWAKCPEGKKATTTQKGSLAGLAA
jgi:hypothetical protein